MGKQNKNIYSTTCPNCKLSTAILLDHKKLTENNLMYICQACGNVFTKANPLYNESNKTEKKN